MKLSSQIGFGLRSHHYHKLQQQENLPVLEVLSDNYMYMQGGPALYHLEAIASRSSELLMHGIGLNIGGTAPLDKSYLVELKKLQKTCKAKIVSDHLCFTRNQTHSSFDLLPVLCNSFNLKRIAQRVIDVQDYLQMPLALENPSTYVEYQESEFTDLEFLNALCDLTGAKVLLDINNVFVCSVNHNFDAWTEITKLNPKHIVQYHIAGHTDKKSFLLDTHDELICQKVWELTRKTIDFMGLHPVIIERDDEVSFSCLEEERKKACSIIFKDQAIYDASENKRIRA